MIKIKYPFISVETNHTALIFEIKKHTDLRSTFQSDKYYIAQKFYGLKKDKPTLVASKPLVCISGSNSDYNIDQLITSSVGDGNQNEPSVLIDSEVESFTNRFYYHSSRIIKGEVVINGPHTRNIKETLEIVEVDKEGKLELHHYYSLMNDSDVIVCKNKIVNKGNTIKIKRLASLHLPLLSNDLTIYSFDGSWAFERTRHTTNLNNGTYVIDSKIGSSSAKHNPFFEVIDNTKHRYYGFNLIYSGNHKEIIEANHYLKQSYIQIGINDFLFSYEVKKNESFITPEAIMVVAKKQDDITLAMHDFALKHIVRPTYQNKVRPIIFNSWEGSTFKINEDSLLEMAKVAHDLGIEQFVVDDGWFKNRIDEKRALGDWIVDKNKFPHGMGVLANKIRDIGMKFGFWVEPEMISIDSDLYRTHKDYASIIPSRTPMPRRHQQLLDMSNPKVVDYLFKVLSKVIDQSKPEYIKWDYNRFMTDNYSNYGTKKGEFMYRFIYGTYDLLNRLTNKYPNILFESCSSGGCRYDLGMLYYMPQTWGSDDTNSYFRTFITCGTLVAYPQSSYGAHVSIDTSLKTSVAGISSLEDRFNINAMGAFGYELDVRKLNAQELAIIKEQIKYYKKHRQLLQFGHFYINDNCFDDARYYASTVINNQQDEAIAVLVETALKVKKHTWKLKGLNPKYQYIVSMRPQANLKKEEILNITMSGKDLMNKGINLGSLSNTTDAKMYRGIYSRMLYLKKK